MKIGKRLFKKFVNGQDLILSCDGFISNNHWAIKKELLDSVLNGVTYTVKNDKVVSLISALTSEKIGQVVIFNRLLVKVEKEICFINDIEFEEYKENNKEYLKISNVKELQNYGIDKFYYEVIQRIVGEQTKVKIFKLNYIHYYKNHCNGGSLEVKNGSSIFFIWTKNNVDDLDRLLAVCGVCRFD